MKTVPNPCKFAIGEHVIFFTKRQFAALRFGTVKERWADLFGAGPYYRVEGQDGHVYGMSEDHIGTITGRAKPAVDPGSVPWDASFLAPFTSSLFAPRSLPKPRPPRPATVNGYTEDQYKTAKFIFMAWLYGGPRPSPSSYLAYTSRVGRMNCPLAIKWAATQKATEKKAEWAAKEAAAKVAPATQMVAPKAETVPRVRRIVAAMARNAVNSPARSDFARGLDFAYADIAAALKLDDKDAAK